MNSSSRSPPTAPPAIWAWRSPSTIVGQAHVGADDLHERLVGPPRLVELHDRDPQPLLVDLARLGREHVAADVGRVAGRGEEGHAVVAAEDRRADGDVVELPRRLPGVVGDQHVAGPQRVERVGAQEVAHGEGHRVDVARRAGHRLGDHVAAAVEDARPRGRRPRARSSVNAVRCSAAACSLTTPMRRFQQTSRVTGSMHRRPRLPARHLTSSTTSVGRSSTRQRAPGPMTAVDSRSSTMAGPSKRVAGAERVAVVDRRLDEAAGLVEVGRPRALQRACAGLAPAGRRPVGIDGGAGPDDGHAAS